MFCGKCGNSIPAEAQYCGHCGAATARTPVAEPSLTSPAPVTKRKSTAWHWPKIDDAKTARDAALEGVGVSLFVSAVTGGTAVLSILSRKPILGVDGWALFDAALFALVGWRIYRMSRVWAVLGLLLYLAEMAARSLQYFETSGGTSIPPFSIVAAIFTLGFVNAVRGIFAFDRFNKPSAEPQLSGERPWVGPVLIAVCAAGVVGLLLWHMRQEHAQTAAQAQNPVVPAGEFGSSQPPRTVPIPPGSTVGVPSTTQTVPIPPDATIGVPPSGASEEGGAKNPTTSAARSYYQELYAAGGLDRFADGYACFEDDPANKAFFIFGEGKHIREYMLADGTFGKMPKEVQQLMRKDFLLVRGYDKGIPWKSEDWLVADEGSWIGEERMLDKHTPIRIRFTVNMQTLRYKWAVEVLNPDSSYKSELASFGKCEKVPSGVPQHGGVDQ